MGGLFEKLGVAIVSIACLAASPVAAQVRTIDPNQAIDGDLSGKRSPAPAPSPAPDSQPGWSDPVPVEPVTPQSTPAETTSAPRVTGTATAAPGTTYQKEDVLTAAENVFGRGAKGLAGLIERILRDQGEPNAYIAGREASGAFALGLRYGSGTLSHKVEGEQPIFWAGPSLGFDVGGDATKVFVLAYNLYDTEDAYHRFPGGEGRLYFVGGFSATYLRRGNVVLIPVRLGVGWRAGVNVNYMKFTHKSRWFPF